jgi:peroxiredoxin
VDRPWDGDDRTAAIFAAAEQRWLEHWRAGPTRRRWSVLPVQVGDRAPDGLVLDGDSREVTLSSQWAERPCVLLFWRHWGCGCGVGRAERLRDELDQLTTAGGNVVVIGQGEPERASWYRAAFDVRVPILVDPTGDLYAAYGLLEMSPWLLLGEPKPAMTEFESWIPQHREKGRPVADNPFLLPGEFVVGTDGRLVLTYRYQYCDNYPDIEALVDSIAEAVASSAADSQRRVRDPALESWTLKRPIAKR